MAGNDPKYRLLFSHPRMIEDLLRGFIHEDWVAQLDFGTLERVNGSFVSEDLEDRRNDVVWRLRWRGARDDWFYLYLLLEFQSRPEPFMAVRMLVYVGLLLQELIRTQRLKASTGCRPSCRSSSTTASAPGGHPSTCSASSRPFRRACAGACRGWSTSWWMRAASAAKTGSRRGTWSPCWPGWKRASTPGNSLIPHESWPCCCREGSRVTCGAFSPLGLCRCYGVLIEALQSQRSRIWRRSPCWKRESEIGSARRGEKGVRRVSLRGLSAWCSDRWSVALVPCLGVSENESTPSPRFRNLTMWPTRS
jgi:hypothetical protein